MKPLSKKIEELKKEIEDKMNELKEEFPTPSMHPFLARREGKLEGYQEVQKLMDETLKNIIDEIDERLKYLYKKYGETTEIDFLNELKQIIQKHFNNPLRSENDDFLDEGNTSILDDFCEELKDLTTCVGCSKEYEYAFRTFCENIDKLKKKHGGKE